MARAGRRTRLAAGAAGVALLLGVGLLGARWLGWLDARGHQGEGRLRAALLEAPRLDVRERSRRLAAQRPFRASDLPLGVEGLADADAGASFARQTAEDYRQRARYPNWSQPLEAGEDPLLHKGDTQDAVRPAARLSGSYRDRLDGGDLVIDAELEVASPGRFHLEATLYSEDGRTAIAWAQHTAELTPGRHWLPLRFHGLILHERRIDGPYLLRFVSLAQIPGTQVELVENALFTRPYEHTAFSDQPFNDPELLDAAERIERAIEALADGGN